MKQRYDQRAKERVVTPGMSVWVSQVSELAGVRKGTRWLPGLCLSCAGSKIAVRLDDGRIIQRHLDAVVPGGRWPGHAELSCPEDEPPTLIEILTPFSGVGTLSKMLPFFGITLAHLGTQFRCFPGVTDPKTGAERVPDTKKRSRLGESGSQKAPRHLFDGA